jgi:hypothetical protein
VSHNKHVAKRDKRLCVTLAGRIRLGRGAAHGCLFWTELILNDCPSPWKQPNIMVVGLTDDGVDGVNSASDDGESLDHVHLPHGTQRAPLMLTQLAHTLQCRRQRMAEVLIDDTSRDVHTIAHVVASLHDDHLLLAADEHRLGLFQQLIRHASSILRLTPTGKAVSRSLNGAVCFILFRLSRPLAASARSTWTLTSMPWPIRSTSTKLENNVFLAIQSLRA